MKVQSKQDLKNEIKRLNNIIDNIMKQTEVVEVIKDYVEYIKEKDRQDSIAKQSAAMKECKTQEEFNKLETIITKFNPCKQIKTQ